MKVGLVMLVGIPLDLVVTILIALSVTGCSFKKEDAPLSRPSQLTDLEIKPEDWVVTSGEKGNATFLTKTVRAEKIDFLRKNFRVPSITPVTIPEANGFQLYEMKGYPELEKAVYVHPKVFISSGSNSGSILGYKSSQKDAAHNDLVTISVPIALVNGIVPAIPIVGGPQVGAGAAVSLPSNFKIESVDALKSKLGKEKELKTLPVCPKFYRLTFEGREYLGKNPFASASHCPLNQFFRVEFEAPAASMRKLLETAAIREEAVSLHTDLELPFEYPTKRVDISFKKAAFRAQLEEELKTREEGGATKDGGVTYSTTNIEGAITDALFSLSSSAGFRPKLSRGINAVITEIVEKYFTGPLVCHDGGLCRALLRRDNQRTDVAYSWLETESLASTLQTQTLTHLGAVANSSRFVSRPAQDQLEKMRRPSHFRNKRFSEIAKECAEMGRSNSYPGKTSEDKQSLRSYCDTIVFHAIPDTQEVDGYYPLGVNTVVYPGAWLKLDIDNIAEFTTAKTRQNKDGSLAIESQIVDLLANEDPAKRTQCTKGARVACSEHKKKTIEILDNQGNKVRERTPCPKSEEGVNGCRCEKQGEKESCFKEGGYRFQEVLDFHCDAKDSFSYCPYWRTEEQIIGYSIQYECQNVKTESKTTFLCMDGCSEKHELRCQEKERKEIRAQRQVLNCIEDENEHIAKLREANAPEKDLQRRATAHRVQGCRRPQYRCARWENACTQYSVNEAFHIIHEEVAPAWRPFAVEQGEYPARFEEDVYLKFVSRNHVATNCRLSGFPRELRGNTMYIKIPSERNEEVPCDRPLWTSENAKSDNLPKAYIKNAISYPERRMCGKTEYTFLTREIPLTNREELVPGQFSLGTEVRMGPIAGSCTAENSFRVGPNLWFTEYPLIRFSGRVSVLGRMLETVLTENR